nr:ABC transporter substrate-binding protein [Bradyrhizobium sp. 45]
MVLRPGLAERWERINAQSLRLFLRKGVAFHDGTSLTAEDVAFSLGPDTCSDLDAAECPRRFTRLIGSRKSKSLILLPSLCMPRRRRAPRAAFGCLRIGDRQSARLVAAGSWERWTTAPVGSGPYKLVDHKLDIRVSLAAHDSYWGGRSPVRWHRIAHPSRAFRARERPARQRADPEKRRSI